jgi:hypothetical protein
MPPGPVVSGIPPEVETAAVATGTALAELENAVAATATALAGLASPDASPPRASLPPTVVILLASLAIGAAALIAGAVYFLTKNRSRRG